MNDEKKKEKPDEEEIDLEDRIITEGLDPNKIDLRKKQEKKKE
jgi:hypothetical protein